MINLDKQISNLRLKRDSLCKRLDFLQSVYYGESEPDLEYNIHFSLEMEIDSKRKSLKRVFNRLNYLSSLKLKQYAN